MNEVVSLLCESEIGDRAALDQHSTSANESVEEAWRISSAPRVKCTEWLFFTNNGALWRVMADNGGNGEPGMSYLCNVNQEFSAHANFEKRLDLSWNMFLFVASTLK